MPQDTPKKSGGFLSPSCGNPKTIKKPLDTERMFGYYIFSTNERIMTESIHPQDNWDGLPTMALHHVVPCALREKRS
jgi:hypothetical protein